MGSVTYNLKFGQLIKNAFLFTLALLPQNPQTVFIRDTVRADLTEMLEVHGVPKAEREKKIMDVAEKLSIASLLDRNPFDLSGGEGQKCALAKVLLTAPRILLLDEPTKGIDAGGKSVLREILNTLKAEGITVLMVTHDVEFAAETADRCALFFDGEILSADTPHSSSAPISSAAVIPCSSSVFSSRIFIR